MGQHRLIAIGTSKYEHLGAAEQRPQLEAVVNRIASLFTDTLKVYRRELGEVALNPGAAKLREALDGWFAAEDRDPADWVVLYYTGHAEVVREHSLYLLTSDFRPPQHVATAFSFDQLADMIGGDLGPGRPRQVANLLLIVDTCFAGQAVQTLATQLVHILSRTGGRSFYVLGAALPSEEAQAGALARAMVEAIEELSRRSVTQEWLYFDQIIAAINQRLGIHQAIFLAASSPKEIPKFFPNPSFVETHGLPVVARDAQRAISEQEFRDHWGPRSRGVEFDSQPGFYFSGRRAVLSRLGDFLSGKEDGRVRLLTGGPGSGKSAILSRIVSGGWPKGPGRQQLDLALHLKGRRLEEAVERMAAAAGVAPSIEAILEGFAESRTPRRIVVDALDEAAEAAAIADQLLAPLGRLANVRLVVGTRRTELKRFADSEIIDIDRPEFADQADIAAYVEARLLRRDEWDAETPYRGREDAARAVARDVAGIAYPNFLLARLGVEDLLARPRAAEAGEDLAFPRSIDEAFGAYLARFGDRETLVRDILVPLAWAEGGGLPWDNIWAPLAAAIAGRDRSDEDVRWVLERAGAFVLEATVDGRSAYRLYHQALADTLRRGHDSEEVHARFTEVLAASPPPRADGRGVDWLLASRYAKAHLATHAGACGRLQLLLADPLYLLAASPGPLLRELAALRSPRAAALRTIYGETVRYIREESLGTAAAYLEMAARQRNFDALADRAAEIAVARPWRVPWARWEARPANRSIAKGTSRVRALALSSPESHEPIAVVGREDGSVEAWDVLLGELLLRWWPHRAGAADHVAVVATDEGALVLASWEDGLLGSINLETRQEILRQDADLNEVKALCAGPGGAGPVCVTTHGDRRIAVRSLPDLVPLVERPNATIGKQYGARIVQDQCRPALLTVGDFLDPNEDVVDRSNIRLWSIEDLSLLWEDGRNERNVPHFIDTGKVGGRSVVIISEDSWRPCSIWDMEQRRLLYTSEEPSKRAWVFSDRDVNVLLELYLGKLTVRPLSTTAYGPLTATDLFLADAIELPGDQFSDIVWLQGRPSLLGVVADHVRIWDLEALVTEALGFRPRPGSHADDREPIGSLKGLCTAPARPSDLYAVTAAQLLCLDAATGNARWEREFDAARGIEAADFDQTGDRVAVAEQDGSISAFAAENGRFSRSVELPSRTVTRLRAVGLGGRSIVLATVDEGRLWSVRGWDLDSAVEVTDGRLRLNAGEEDKQLLGLAAAEAGGSLRVAFASKYGKVMVADIGKPPRQGAWCAYDEWYVPYETGEYVTWLETFSREGEVLLAAATENGTLALWNFITGKVEASHAEAHLGHIGQLRFGMIGESDVLASGGSDGFLRIWTLGLEQLLRIDIGEPVSALAWTGPGRLAVGSTRGLLTLDAMTLDSA